MVERKHLEDQAATRRDVLAGAAALGATTLLPGVDALAQGTKPRVFDTHHHFFPPEYQKIWIDYENKHIPPLPHYPTQVTWTTEKSIEAMDQAGVRTAMLSVASTPGVWFDQGPQAASRMARLCNDYAADMMRDHPGRFGLFATLSMLDIDATLKEIEYAFDTLHADGVGLQTNYGDKWPGDPVYKPVFDELNRRKTVVYFHPLVPSCCDTLDDGAHQAVLEVPFDTTRAAVSLLLNGSFARYRDIKWLFSHGGGTLPFLAGRIESRYDEAKNRAEFAPDGIEAEFKRLYYDTANVLHPAAWTSLHNFVPSSHILFGSDFPYFAPAGLLEKLSKTGASRSEICAIQSGNAESLVPRLKKA